MRHLSSTVILVFMTAFSSQLEAGTWRVEVDGSGEAPTIQAAIDSSSHGDLVLVGPGTYFEHLNFKGKNIWLKSFAGAEVTILDGNWQAGSVIQLVSGETNDAIVDGFTVTHGTGVPISEGADGNIGGGLYAEDSWPTVRNCLFIDNVPTGAKTFGGAILFRVDEEATPGQPILIDNNTFIANEATNGGAIVSGSDALITNNVFVRNTTNTGDGAAIWCNLSWHGPMTIRGNQFWENEADDHGGAIELGGRLESWQLWRTICLSVTLPTARTGPRTGGQAGRFRGELLMERFATTPLLTTKGLVLVHPVERGLFSLMEGTERLASPTICLLRAQGVRLRSCVNWTWS